VLIRGSMWKKMLFMAEASSNEVRMLPTECRIQRQRLRRLWRRPDIDRRFPPFGQNSGNANLARINTSRQASLCYNMVATPHGAAPVPGGAVSLPRNTSPAAPSVSPRTAVPIRSTAIPQCRATRRSISPEIVPPPAHS